MLDALAERVGILSGYESALDGRFVRAPDESKVAVLRARGLDASDEARARSALESLDEAERARLLPPTHVVPAERPVRLRVRRPPRGGRYTLTLHEAGGGVYERHGRLSAEGSAHAGIALPPCPAGRHRARIRIESPDGTEHVGAGFVIAAPRRAVEPGERLSGRRAFGLWANLYSLRSERGTGVGDLSHLARLVEWTGERGGAFVGVNPLHAIHDRGLDVSPYAPVSRLFRNPLYLDDEAVPELAESDEARAAFVAAAAAREALRRGDRIDYAGVMAARRPVHEALHRAFTRSHATTDTPRGRAFRAFCADQGAALEDFATFAALAERMEAEGHPRDWRRWPRAFQHPDAPAVRSFRAQHRARVDLHVYLQFELDRQLARVAARAAEHGLELGLYSDLALGSAPSGFDTWAHRELFVEGVSVGAPPDDYNAAGQDWGFPPLCPEALARDGYAYWSRILRTAFEHAGALRIDHILGLFRQWWVPPGCTPAEGVYVQFPHEPLLSVLALESHRAGAIAIGEDLGTVPRRVPAALARRGVLSSRVLLFERERSGRFRPASRYSGRALVTANTHDFPPLQGWWRGRDLALRRALHVLPDDAALAAARSERAADRRALLARLRAAGVLGAEEATRAGEPATAPGDDHAPVVAIHRFLASTPCPLLGISLDDLAGEEDPVNLPGVPTDRWPSWQRRMGRSLEEIVKDPEARAILDAVQALRPGGPPDADPSASPPTWREEWTR
jgi:4-alpha-glucanotransferase